MQQSTKLNKLSVRQKFDKVLTLLAVIYTVIMLGFMLHEVYLYKINKPHRLNTMEDAGNVNSNKSRFIAWEQLAATEVTYQNKNSDELIAPQYSDELIALNKQPVIITGFMFPLEAGDKQTHFLLSPYATTCAFCLPAGPNELIDVYATDPTPVDVNRVIVKGQFQLLTEQSDLQGGMLYRMNNATVE